MDAKKNLKLLTRWAAQLRKTMTKIPRGYAYEVLRSTEQDHLSEAEDYKTLIRDLEFDVKEKNGNGKE